MADTLKTYTADHELAALLKTAARAGGRVRVKADDETYIVRIERDTDAETGGIWANYDADQVRAAVRRSAALGSSADLDEVKRIIDDIRAQRDQAPRRSQS